jgi:hypothetical protein
MKTGDKLYCHKETKDFVKGQMYKIVGITSVGNLMIGGPKIAKPSGSRWFYKEGVYRYFYTIQEVRKMKLMKINEQEKGLENWR